MKNQPARVRAPSGMPAFLSIWLEFARRQPRWFLGAVAFLCAAFLLHVGYRPYAAAARDLARRRETSQAALLGMDARRATWEAAIAESSRLEEKRKKLAAWIPEDPAVSEWTGSLNKLSQSTAVHLSDIRIESSDPSGNYGRTPVRMAVQGAPGNIVRFIQELTSLERLVSIESLVFKPRGKGIAEAEVSTILFTALKGKPAPLE